MWIAVGFGVLGAALSLALRRHYSDTTLVSDFDQITLAARLLRAHRDPYQLIGPGLPYAWGWRFYYPLPAVLIAVPLSWLTLPVASAVFVGCSSALLAFGLSRDGYQRFPVFLSAPFFHAAWLGQWSILLTAAVLLPWLGVAFAGKPTIGGALWLSRPSWIAVAGASVLIVVSLAVQPSWPREWFAIVRSGLHHRPPISYIGGFVVLLALLRWRRFDARLLLLLALAPQTADVFECVPLFLIPETFRESVLLAVTTTLAYLAFVLGPSLPDLATQATRTGWLIVFGAYLPALVMVLRRPSVAT